MEKTNTRKQGMARLMELAFTQRLLIIVSAILSAASAVASFVPYITVYYIIRELVLHINDLSALDDSRMIALGLLSVGGAVGAIALNFSALMCSHVAAFKTLFKLKLDFMRHVASLPLGFHTRNSTGKLRKVVDENIEKLESFIAHQFPDLVATFVTPVTAVVLLFFFDWRMGLCCFVPVLMLYMMQAAATSGKKARENLKKYQDTLEEMNNAAVEYVRGVSVVKAFNQTVFSFRRFYETIKSYGDWALGYTKSYQPAMVLYVTILNAIYLFLVPTLIFLYGGVTDYPAFALAALFYIIFSMALPGLFMKIMYVSHGAQQTWEGVKRMDQILDTPALPAANSPKRTNEYSVTFDNVTFSYNAEGESVALAGVSFTAVQGKTTALVGPSGGGKSTIAHLIPRFYDTAEGSIRIGGVDIREMDDEYLMSIVGFVFQDVFLFKQSIMDNLLIGSPKATREEAIGAAKAAQCHEFVEKLPNGYDTVIGAKGVHLSGGERQRIVIARAILKDAPILVLDEATAFADPENERKIQLALAALMKNKTVIMIAHRLSTVSGADDIIVIDKGRVSEHGRHDDLLAAQGMYSRMWERYSEALHWSIAKGGAIHA
ncbi:MAG: ABC transporter ATP-binding protein/permease [Oscillospiraceae bacterium]|jgi:ATP-binding cassette subfamily B protein|nr:ABC transporter ATP-binding protein/permease [Oscillospiraceae bacterium]